MKVSDSLKQVLSAVAPALATALGGPLAGAAVSWMTEKLGVSKEEIEKTILSMNPEQLVALRQIDRDFEVKMKELDVDLVKIASEDRRSARDLAARDNTPQKLISFIVMGLYLVVVGLITWLVQAKTALDANLLGVFTFILGSLFREIPTIMQFWFGSSAGSQAKSDDLAKLLESLRK